MFRQILTKFRERQIRRMDKDFAEILKLNGAVSYNEKSPKRMKGSIGLEAMDKLPLKQKMVFLGRIFPNQLRNLKTTL